MRAPTRECAQYVVPEPLFAAESGKVALFGAGRRLSGAGKKFGLGWEPEEDLSRPDVRAREANIVWLRPRQDIQCLLFAGVNHQSDALFVKCMV